MEKPQWNGPFSPSHLSALQLSKQLWAQPDMKQLALQCIEEGKHWSRHEVTDLQKKLRTEISRKIDEMKLSDSVKKEVRFAVESMGLRLQQWAKGIKGDEKFSVDLALYIDHIRWTDYGCIDMSETVRAMYYSKVFPENFETWKQLSEYCLEDCLVDLWPKLSETDKHREMGDHSMLSGYWDMRRKYQIEKGRALVLPRSTKNVDFHTAEEKVFVDSSFYGNYSAVKYSWELLSHEERKRSIRKISEELLKFFDEEKYPPAVFNSGHDKGLDFVIFLSKELSFHGLNHLWTKMLKSSHVLHELLKWPYQGSFMEALKESWKYPKDFEYTLILIEILHQIDILDPTGGADSQYRDLFLELWEKIIRDKRHNIPCGGRRSAIDWDSFIGVLCLMGEIDWLTYIFNDARLEDTKKYRELCAARYFSHRSDPVFLDEFVQKVFVSEEERGEFKDFVGRRAEMVQQLTQDGAPV